MTRAKTAALVIIALLSVAVYALTLTGPSWSPASAFTNNTLNCSWSSSADTIAQNITVLRNGALYNSTYENASLVNLSAFTLVHPDNTTKGDTFLCSVTLYNGTATTQANASLAILNSPPTTEGSSAGIFYENGTDVGYTIAILEDQALVIDVNATDADNDTLTYQNADEFCVRNSSSTGVYTCTPAQSDLTSDTAVTLTNITFTVTDGQNVGGRTITFNITPVNDAPTVTVTNQSTPVNQSKNVTFSASDTESDYPLTLQLIAPGEISDKLTLTPLNANGTSFSVYYDAATPDYNDVGAWNVSVHATDNSTNITGGNDSLSALGTFILNITAVGRKPYFLAITPNGTYAASQGQLIQINITANDSDVNSTITFSDDTTRFAISTVKSDTNASAAIGQINFTPANDDVGEYSVTVTITDQESLTNTTVLAFNVTNVNDAPTVNEISDNATNTAGATNASNLTGYANARFTYTVNATDPDTIHGDSLAYSDNTTLFAINATTGLINFTPTDAQVGIHNVNVSVTDESGLNASRTLVINISPNSPPYFNATVPGLNCTTGSSCTAFIGQYATDPDAGDNVSNFTMTLNTTLGTFSYNATTGLINFTPAKEDIGHYRVNVTIADTFGSTNSSAFTLQVNNTPVAPNLTRYNLSTETIVETHAVSYELRATDDDFLAAGADENVTFTTNLSISHTITPLSTQNITARATLAFTPSDGSAGNVTIHINATDAYGLVSQRNVTFEILDDIPPPNITQITPWGTDNATHDIQTTYANTTDSQFQDGIADVNATENSTVLFNVTVNDTRPVTYNWTVNGTQVATDQNYTRAFGFFDSGRYIVVVNVSNDRLESARFTWNVTVRNVNRAPLLITNLTTPLSVNGTATYTDYFLLGNGTKFIDPDDDLDSDNQIDGNESNALTFAANQTCAVATLGVSGANLVVTGASVGSCIVAFTATDAAGLNITSAAVNVTIIDVPEDTTTTTTTSSGGGGSSSSTFIPISRDRETPKAFSLIAPKLVTIYSNDSLEIPVVVNNTWKEELKFVRLFVEANVTGVTATLSSDLIETLPVNGSVETTLTVSGYRLGENYEIRVAANVSDPQYEDSALILLNSLQRSSEGEEVDVKVTFANDLLSEHPECQELNEVLDQAKERLRQNRVEDAGQLVDAVINGCRYLVSTKQRIEERPGRINPIINLGDLSTRTILWSALAFALVVSIATVAYYHYTRTPEDDI